MDKQDLQEELTNVNKLNSAIDPELASKAITEKEEEIEVLQNQYEKSQSQLMMSQQTMSELKRENDQLRQENQQYEAILDKLQREETNLKDKINKETQEVRDMKQKYEELEQEYQQQEAFGKKQSLWAQEILVEVDDLRSQYQNHLTTIERGDSQEFDPTNKNLGGGHSPAKTLRIGPQTLRLANMDTSTLRLTGIDSDLPMDHQRGHSYQHSYNPVFNTPQIGKRSSEMEYKLRLNKAASTVSVDYGKASHIISPSMQYVQYDTREPLSSEEDDELKQATDSDLSARNYFEIKEQLQTEFDDKLAGEKGKLIEKHKGEMNAMREELAEYTDQLKEFKKKLVSKDQEIRKLKRSDGVKNGRGQTTNPNNQGDACGKCKVFSWRAW